VISATLLFASALWALTQRASGYFLWYLCLQVVSLPTLYACLWLYGMNSTIYIAFYATLTGLILLSMVAIAWSALWCRQYRLRPAAIALVLALVIGRRSFVGLERPMRFEDWIVLAEAVVLLWAGILVAYVARYRAMQWAFFTLGVVWIGYALWDFGLILNYPDWLMADWYVPSAWLTLGFTVLGFLLRFSHEAHAEDGRRTRIGRLLRTPGATRIGPRN
jgi:hypothetical protein